LALDFITLTEKQPSPAVKPDIQYGFKFRWASIGKDARKTGTMPEMSGISCLVFIDALILAILSMPCNVKCSLFFIKSITCLKRIKSEYF
jgi:hypothetical protein